MNDKLPININDLLTRRTIEDERIEFKESWNPEAILHTLCAFANDFHNLGGGYVIVGVAEKEGIPQLPPKGLQPEQIDKIHKELLQLEKHDIVPAFHTLTATYEIQGKLILVLWAVGGEMRPYRAKKSLSGKIAIIGHIIFANIPTRLKPKARLNKSCFL
ncbi:AlbA family DNA-binding domain-containing protein [Haemophilus parahaemolyticus]|uniref:AlbA family DNA-binding domain-containing protein n=1 Tax=Haemophilus parahaemolyticus TaxID=735 RepID=UPI0024909E2D|nr:ATP-binding protein [Haemophilus parahaemolyticus]